MMPSRYNIIVLVLGYSFQIVFSKSVNNEIGEPDSDEYVDLSGEGCGIVRYRSEKRGRIVGGARTTFGEYPWQVAFIDIFGTIECGGSLINHEWILTAAHCFRSLFYLQGLKARIGDYDLYDQDEPFKHAERNLVELINHPEFDSDTFHNDVALVKMDKPVKFRLHIQPICLYAKDNSLIGNFPKASGWGYLREWGLNSDVLQAVTLPVLKNKVCEKLFISIDKKTPLKKMFICAGYRQGGKDTCQGDSGGPLQLKLKSKRWALIGITSWGFGCARTSRPGLSTRVSYYLPWIQKTLKERS